MTVNLSTDLHTTFSKFGKEGGEMELMSFVRQTMFDSVVRQLYGPDNAPPTENGMREMERNFFKYDTNFEYGTQLPEFLMIR